MHNDEPRIELRQRPQRTVLLLITLSHALAMAVGLLLPVGLWWRLALAGGIVVSLRHGLRAHWQRTTPNAVCSLIWQSDGRWLITDKRGQHRGQLSDYYLAPRWMVLKFRRHPAVLLNADTQREDVWRLLRTRLRHGDVTLARLLRRRRENHDYR